MEKTCLVHGQSFVSFWRPTYRQREVCNLGWVVVMFVSQRASSSYCLWQPWWWLWELDLEACGGGSLWSFSPVIIGGLVPSLRWTKGQLGCRCSAPCVCIPLRCILSGLSLATFPQTGAEASSIWRRMDKGPDRFPNFLPGPLCKILEGSVLFLF
jgi:hypothetical protein